MPDVLTACAKLKHTVVRVHDCILPDLVITHF